MGGHPFLLDESFKYLRINPTQTLQQVKEESPTQTGIFNHHLGEILETLDSHQYLKDDYIKIIQQFNRGIARIDAQKTHSFSLSFTEHDLRQTFPYKNIPLAFINDMEAIGYGIFLGDGEDKLYQFSKV